MCFMFVFYLMMCFISMLLRCWGSKPSRQLQTNGEQTISLWCGESLVAGPHTSWCPQLGGSWWNYFNGCFAELGNIDKSICQVAREMCKFGYGDIHRSFHGRSWGLVIFLCVFDGSVKLQNINMYIKYEDDKCENVFLQKFLPISIFCCLTYPDKLWQFIWREVF